MADKTVGDLTGAGALSGADLLHLVQAGNSRKLTLEGLANYVNFVAGFEGTLLFAAGEQGAWYRPDPTTCFTDTARTTAAAVGDAVAGMTDLSGRGNHATQSTLAQRPILSREPATGRRNLLTYTEQFDNAIWAKGSFTGTITANTTDTLDPLGGNTAEKFDATVAGSFILQAIATTAQAYTYSFYAKAGTAGTIRVNVFDTSDHRAVFNLSDGTLASSFGITSSASVDVGNGWWRLSITFTAGAATNSTRVFCPEIGVVYVWGAQLETGSTATAYQRVVTARDVTEAGQPDRYYLFCDGSDDGMVTSAIDFSGTDAVSVFAGVRKLSDAARGTIFELTASADSNNGAFHLTAPNAASATYAFESKGTTLTDAVASTGVAAPNTSVVTGLADISADGNIIRINRVQADSDTGDQGTGNYANAILYLFRRGGTTLPFRGHFYGGLIVGRATTATEINGVERYLAYYSGVTL